jgi:hypothetical protein
MVTKRKKMVDIYTKLYILNFCSIFSQAVEIPKDKNRMNKVITQPLIGQMISSKPLTHHEILLKNKQKNSFISGQCLGPDKVKLLP